MPYLAWPTTTTHTIAWTGYTAAYSYMDVAPIHVETPRVDQQEDDVEELAWRSVRELLTSQEKRLLSRYEYLPVKSRLHSGCTYRIHMDADTPHVYYRGKYVGYLCIDFSDDDMPDADTLLMHKLWIEGDEAGYLREANSWRGRNTPSACAWLEKEE